MRRPSCTACRHRCSPTTERCSWAATAAARWRSSTSCSAWVCSSRTQGPITRRRWARSSAYTRRSSATWQSSLPRTLSELQEQLGFFVHYYNNIRPHRALGRRTPLQAYSARAKARPVGAQAGTYFRVREDKVDKAGKVSLRYGSRLYKIGLGRAHKGRVIRLLIADQNIRVIDANGELIRELTLDPSRIYQPLGRASRVQDVPTHVSGMS